MTSSITTGFSRRWLTAAPVVASAGSLRSRRRAMPCPPSIEPGCRAAEPAAPRAIPRSLAGIDDGSKPAAEDGCEQTAGRDRMNVSALFITAPDRDVRFSASPILLGGLLGYNPILPVSALPQVDFPTIQVTTQLPGANPGYDGRNSSPRRSNASLVRSRR